MIEHLGGVGRIELEVYPRRGRGSGVIRTFRLRYLYFNQPVDPEWLREGGGSSVDEMDPDLLQEFERFLLEDIAAGS